MVEFRTSEKTEAKLEEVKSMSIYSKLAAIQQEVKLLDKTKTANIPTKKGKYSYNYAPLDHTLPNVLLPLFKKYNLFTHWCTKADVNSSILITAIVNLDNPSESIKSEVHLAELGTGFQDVGKACTYLSRYCLYAALGLVTTDVDTEGDDDDDDDDEPFSGNPRSSRKSSNRSSTRRRTRDADEDDEDEEEEEEDEDAEVKTTRRRGNLPLRGRSRAR